MKNQKGKNIFVSIALCMLAITTSLKAVGPSWWTNSNYQVIDNTKSPAHMTSVTVGQFKHAVTKTKDYIDNTLGTTIADWDAIYYPHTNPFPLSNDPATNKLVMNQGQAKYVINGMYYLLITQGINTSDALGQYRSSGPWLHPKPWTFDSLDDDHDAPLLQGQLKWMLSFDLTLFPPDFANSLPDWWKQFIVDADALDPIAGLSDVHPVYDPSLNQIDWDFDRDGISNLREYALSSDPLTPQLWRSTFVGDINNVGSFEIAIDESTYTLNAGGGDIWQFRDDFYFAYQEVQGNFEFTAKVDALSGTHQWTKAALVMRESLNDGSRSLSLVSAVNDVIQILAREDENIHKVHVANNTIVDQPVWLKIRRIEDTIVSYYSQDGINWTHYEHFKMNLADTLYVGLASSSYEAHLTANAVFSNVSLQYPSIDTDNDGLTDFYETQYALDPADDGTTNMAYGALGDPDGDRLTNIQEQRAGLLPNSTDSDSDGVNDIYGADSVVTHEFWTGLNAGSTLADLKSFDNGTEQYPGIPNDFHHLDSFTVPAGWTDISGNTINNYGARIRGIVKAPEDGTYEFTLNLASGVEADLWLSRDRSVFNKLERLNLTTGQTTGSVTIDLKQGEKYYTEINYVAGTQQAPVSLEWRIVTTTGTNPIPTSVAIEPFYVSTQKFAPNSHWSFDEGTGNVAANSGGNPATQSATLYSSQNVAGPTDTTMWDEGVFGSALLLDGINDYAQLDNIDDPIVNRELTLAAWVRVDDASKDKLMRIFSQRKHWGTSIPTGGNSSTALGNQHGFELNYNPVEQLLVFSGDFYQQFVVYGIDLNDSWNHIALAFEEKIPFGFERRYYPHVYVNGVRLQQYPISPDLYPVLSNLGNITERATVSNTDSQSGEYSVKNPQEMFSLRLRSIHPLTFGSHAVFSNYNENNHFHGALDEIYIFNSSIGDDSAFLFLEAKAEEEEKTKPENWSSPTVWVNEAPTAEFEFPTHDILDEFVSNGDFETGNLSNWTKVGTVTADNANTHAGTYSTKLSGASAEISQTINDLNEGGVYTLSVWGTGESFELGVRNHGELEEVVIVNNQVFAQTTLTFALGAESSSVEVFCRKTSGSGDSWADNLSLVMGIEPPPSNYKFPIELPISQDIEFLLRVEDFENSFIRAELFEVNPSGSDISLGVVDPLNPTVNPLTQAPNPGPNTVDPTLVRYAVNVYETALTPVGSSGKSYYIVAEDYNGSIATSDTITVNWINPPPELEWETPTNNASYKLGDSVTLTAKVTDDRNDIASVMLREYGGADISSGSSQGNDIYSFSVSPSSTVKRGRKGSTNFYTLSPFARELAPLAGLTTPEQLKECWIQPELKITSN